MKAPAIIFPCIDTHIKCKEDIKGDANNDPST